MDLTIFSRDLEQQLCFQVYQAANSYNKMYGKALKPFHLTFPQYLVLLALWDKDNVPIKNIGERIGISIGTLNPILNRLETQGWVHKELSPNDRRSFHITLTPKAHESKEGISLAILKELQHCNVSGLDAAELMKQLETLNRILQQVFQVPPQ